MIKSVYNVGYYGNYYIIMFLKQVNYLGDLNTTYSVHCGQVPPSPFFWRAFWEHLVNSFLTRRLR